MNVIKKDGTSQPRDDSKIQKSTAWACKGLNVSQSELEVTAQAKFFDGIKTTDIENSLIVAGSELISAERPDYKFATARLLLQKTYKEITGGDIEYPHLGEYISKGVAEKQLNPLLEQFDLSRLNLAIRPERDLQFDYLGLQTVVDRYLIRARAEANEDGKLIEMPQHFFMRVAMGLALRDHVVLGTPLNHNHITNEAIAFYDLLSSFDYMSSTPTLFNAGTTHSQLSSCYLNTVADSLYSDYSFEHGHHFASIYGTIEECARLSKYAGGIGTDWTRVRPEGSIIKGTNGKSAGVVPYIKVWNDTAIAVNQGGKRNGAFAAYMEPWHPDFLAFCELRKNSGEERRRAHEIFPAAWIPNLFMQRVDNDGLWSFFAPDEHPDLHELYGDAFSARYEQLEAEGKFRSQMSAKALWQKMLQMLFETGHPWITFKDHCNERSPQDHCGVVHSSNLCTEITLNTSDTETAVCNLGSINLARHVGQDGQLDIKKLQKTVTVATRLLDNVIDINFYPSERSRVSNMRHRPVGMGVMGMTDMLCRMGIDYDSQEALEVQDQLFEAISFFGISESSHLGEVRGNYESFEGSKWNRGILPYDTSLASARALTTSHTKGFFNWDGLRERVRLHMRNSNMFAIAPTATIANITGVVPSTEPPFELEYTKTNLSGQFIVATPALDYGHPVKTAFEINQNALIDGAAVRGKWIDQSQSLNLFVQASVKGRELSALYFNAWYKGVKTTYYLRRKITETDDTTGRAPVAEALATATVEEEVKFCSISNPDCESCQ